MIGEDMDEEISKTLLERFGKQGRRVIYQQDFTMNVQQRLEIYEEKGKPIKCFINVGGNLLSSGGSEDFTRLRTGIIKNGEYSAIQKEKGLIQVFMDRGIPVINLLNIKGLAAEYGVPIDPYPLPEAGTGDIFHEKQYPYSVIALCLGLALSMLVIYGRRARR